MLFVPRQGPNRSASDAERSESTTRSRFSQAFSAPQSFPGTPPDPLPHTLPRCLPAFASTLPFDEK